MLSIIDYGDVSYTLLNQKDLKTFQCSIQSKCIVQKNWNSRLNITTVKTRTDMKLEMPGLF